MLVEISSPDKTTAFRVSWGREQACILLCIKCGIVLLMNNLFYDQSLLILCVCIDEAITAVHTYGCHSVDGCRSKSHGLFKPR